VIATLLPFAVLSLLSLPSPAAPLLEVAVKVTEPLRLVEWVADPREPGDVGLAGRVEVRITNRSAQDLLVERLEVHGFLFTEAASAAEHVIVHPCQCLRDAGADAPPPIRLAPGKVEVLRFDEWGCSGGMWRAPPAGRYRMSYRVRLAAPPESPRPQPGEAQDQHTVRRCAEDLARPGAWAGAVASPSQEVTLKPPQKKRFR
jgi:hypothetical protein